MVCVVLTSSIAYFWYLLLAARSVGHAAGLSWHTAHDSTCFVAMGTDLVAFCPNYS